MKAVKICDNIYWVGAVDWTLRNFHGYTTSMGSTYNAYLIVDETVALIDTVKAAFAGEMLERIASVIDPSKIDVIVSNHVEPDHSGAIPAVLAVAPQAKVITVDPQGVRGLTAHYGPLNYQPVKAGASLSLGRHTLQFTPTPMVHWPDNMVTYCPEEKLLFSNDAFGQHYASSGRFDDEERIDVVFEEARKYYANIVMPYGQQTAAALKAVGGLDIGLICPSHGVIWRKNIPEIVRRYQSWCQNETDGSAAVVYDSMWHSTETMAKTVAETFREEGRIVRLYDLKVCHNSDIISDILTAKYIAVGSPTLNNNMLPTVAGFLTYLRGLAPKGRVCFAFGSYGWGGQSIAQVEQALEGCGFDKLCESVRIQYIPKQDDLDALAAKVREGIRSHS